MHIAYTVNGEGMGHASRSSVVIHQLLERGHRVTIFSSGARPLAFLRERFGSVAEVMGLHMVYKNNAVRRLQTAARVLRNAGAIRSDLRTMRTQLNGTPPDAVITDFDFHGELIARLYKIPLISIDNIQYITQAQFDVAAEDLVDYELNYLVAKMLVPRADHYFITTFDQPTLRRPTASSRVQFIAPLLRKKIIQTNRRIGGHILVYQTSDSYRQLFSILARSSEHFVVYNAQHESPGPNIICKPFNEDVFIDDLASAKAVITNGGFNVITEALYFKKPVLSIPIRHFFEQKLNARLIKNLGYGSMASRLSETVLANFLHDIPSYRNRLEQVTFDNTTFFHDLDLVLSRLTARGAR